MDTPKVKPETNPIARYWAKPSRPNAVKAKCSECMGCTRQEIVPGFRSMIRDCASKNCPLHPWRPYQQKTSRPATQDGGEQEISDFTSEFE